MTRRFFEECQFDVQMSVAGDVRAAREVLTRALHQQALPDLVLLDLNLPGQPGEELLTDIRQHAELQNLRVVVTTSSVVETAIVRERGLQADAFICKPLRPDEFLAMLNELAIDLS